MRLKTVKSVADLVVRMRETPHPRCMACRKSQRAHGLFQIGDKYALLCAEHGFDLGASLIRSFSSKFVEPNKEPKPCTTIQLPGMSTPLETPGGIPASEFLTMLRRQHNE